MLFSKLKLVTQLKQELLDVQAKQGDIQDKQIPVILGK